MSSAIDAMERRLTNESSFTRRDGSAGETQVPESKEDTSEFQSEVYFSPMVEFHINTVDRDSETPAGGRLNGWTPEDEYVSGDWDGDGRDEPANRVDI